MRTLILLLLSALAHAQSDVPEKYWIDDSNFEDTISNDNAFGDDNNETIVVEFWAKFNEANCFNDWKQIKESHPPSCNPTKKQYVDYTITSLANLKKINTTFTYI